MKMQPAAPKAIARDETSNLTSSATVEPELIHGLACVAHLERTKQPEFVNEPIRPIADASVSPLATAESYSGLHGVIAATYLISRLQRVRLGIIV